MKTSSLRKSAVALTILSASIASHVEAVNYISTGSGDWSDPTKWSPAGFPDTFAGDNAEIAVGHFIDFNAINAVPDGPLTTPMTRVAAALAAQPTPIILGVGSLAVANNALLDINGGTLSQANLNNEIRIGDLASGNGTLTIRNNGSFFSGDVDDLASGAVGVVIGGNLNASGVGTGAGVVNINDGLFFMGAGLAALGSPALGVGVEGGRGTLNVGDGTGAPGSATLNLQNHSNLLAIGATNGLDTVGGNGTVVVNSDGSILMGSGNILVGDSATGSGTLTIQGGVVGNSGATGEIRIGSNGGTGILTLTSGSIITGVPGTAGGELNIGRGAGSTGTATVSGGTIDVVNITNEPAISIGRDGGTGILAVSAGTVTAHGTLGVGNGGNSGTVTLSGTGSLVATTTGAVASGDGNYNGSVEIQNGLISIGGSATLSAGGHFNIGQNGGIGRVAQTGGTVTFNQWAAIGIGAGVTGSEWKISGGSIVSGVGFEVGADRDGLLEISGTANVDVGSVVLGTRTGGTGTVNKTGGTLTTRGLFIAGRDSGGAFGTFNLAGGTTTINSGGGQSFVGRRAGSVGTLNISGAGVVLNNVSGEDHLIGFEGGTGNLNVTGGGKFNTNWWLNIARGGSSVGNVLVDGAGSEINIFGPRPNGDVDARLNVGEDGMGTLNITNGGKVQGLTETAVGLNGGSQGRLNINSGSTFTTGNWLIIGNNAGSTGRVDLDDAGSSINLTGAYNPANNEDRARLFVGRNGNGTLNQTNGTITIGGWSAVGLDGTGTGLYNLSGGRITTVRTHDFFVGRGSGAVGTLNVNGTGNFDMLLSHEADPGARTGGRLVVGADDGSQGNVTIDPGTTVSALSFTPGNNGKASVTQNGGTVNVGQWLEVGGGNAADTPANAASYTLNDGLINAQQLVVGTRRAGTVTVNGGVINLGTDGTTANPGWGDFAIGRDGNVENGVQNHGDGHLIINGGTINATGKNLQISRGGPFTKGLVDQSGGAVFTNQVTIGDNGSTNAVVNMSGGTVATNAEYIVGNGVGTSAFLNLSGTGTISSSGEFQVGNNGGTGVANITGGTVNALGFVAIGRNTDQNNRLNGGNGTVNLSGTGVLQKVSGGGSFDVGSWNGGLATTTNTSGTLNQSGGAVVIGNNTNLYVGRDSGVKGTWTITAGDVSANVGEFRVHNNGGAAADVLTVGGAGAFTLIAASNSAVGQGGGTGSGTLNVSNPNATFTFNSEFWVGNDGGNGIMNMTAGTITANSWFDLGRNGGTGLLNFSGGSITKLTGTGTVDIGSSGSGGTGTLNQSAAASLVNTASDTNVGRESGSTGTWNLAGGTATLADLVLGRDGGANGTLDLSGGVITTTRIRAGGGSATLKLGAGTIRAAQSSTAFIDGFTNSGGHSQIMLLGTGPTIDTNSFDDRIPAANVFADTDTAGNGLSGTALTKTGLGTLTLESALDTNGTVAVHAVGGTLDFEADQVIDGLFIENGATVTLSSLSSPPAPPIAPAPAFAESTLETVSSASSVQGVPEPGTIALLLVSVLGMATGRNRRKQS